MKPNPTFNSLNYLFKKFKHGEELTQFLIDFLVHRLPIYQKIKPDKKAFTDAEIRSIQEISKRIKPPELKENNLFEFFSAVYILILKGLGESSLESLSSFKWEEDDINEIKKITNSIKIHALICEFFKPSGEVNLIPGEKKDMDDLRMIFEAANHYDEEHINFIRNHLNKLENGTLKFRPEYMNFVRNYLSLCNF